MSRTLLARAAAVVRGAPWLFAFLGAGVVLLVTLAANQWQGAGQILVATLNFASFYVIVGLGQMFVITTGPGNIDLSMPATIALAGTVAMTVMGGAGAMIPMGLAAALVTGFAVGSFNYALIALLRIPPIIATLSSSFIVQSLAIVYGRGLRVAPPPTLAWLVNSRFLGVPALAWLAVALAAVMALVLHRTVFGRSVLAIGQNTNAAELAGIRVGRWRFAAYALSATMAGLCGTMLAAFTGGASLNMGEEYLLTSIAVVVIGGTSVAGGFSNVPGIWGAALFLYLLATMLNTLGVGAGLRQVATGLIILGVITVAGDRRARG